MVGGCSWKKVTCLFQVFIGQSQTYMWVPKIKKARIYSEYFYISTVNMRVLLLSFSKRNKNWNNYSGIWLKINSDQGENSAINVVINFTLLCQTLISEDDMPPETGVPVVRRRRQEWTYEAKGWVGRNTGFAVICQLETQRKPSLAEEQGFMGLYLCACLQTD